MMRNLLHLSVDEIYVTLCVILLVCNKIDMIPLLCMGRDYEEKRRTEREFKQGLQIVLI